MEQIKFSEVLDSACFNQLINDEICILVVSNYASREVCNSIVKYVDQCGDVEQYTHEEKRDGAIEHRYLGVDRIGVPFNSTLGKNDAIDALKIYGSEALSGIRSLRSACNPFLHPIDRLRLELDEVWVPGAGVATFCGMKMFVGIVRIMNPESSILSERSPHFDSLPQSVCDFSRQIAANCFASVGTQGGELLFWPNVLATELHKCRRDNALTYSPEEGDLILFDSRKPHAIGHFKEGKRVSVQCFIGVDPLRRLHLWN